jgi:hypothetical protein
MKVKVHAAKLKNSKRLQACLAVLRDRQWHSTLAVMSRMLEHGVMTVAPSADINELRCPPNNLTIERRYVKPAEGLGYHEYRLVGRADSGRKKPLTKTIRIV